MYYEESGTLEVLKLVLGLIFCFIIFNLFIRDNKHYTSYIENIPIIAMGNELEGVGSFSGTIFVQSSRYKDEMYYQLMGVKNKSTGEIQYLEVKAKDVIIYEYEENDLQNPHIEIQWKIERDKNGKITKPRTYSEMMNINTDFRNFSDIEAPTEKVTIYVPKGTVNRNIKIDLNK